MRSGLDRFGYAGLIALLLIPALVAVGVRVGVRSYCSKIDRKLVAQAATLSRVAEMEAALRQARVAIQSVPGTAAVEFAGTEEFGRWLHETGKQQHVELQSLALNKDPAANPNAPAFTASFHAEQTLPSILLLLHSLQTPSRLVTFDSVCLRLRDPPPPLVYNVDVSLHAYSLSDLKKKHELK